MRALRLPCLAAALLLFPLAAEEALLSPPAFRLSSSPEKPRQGDLLVLELSLPTEAEAGLGAVRLGPGLSLEASSARPLVDPATGRRGSLLRLELRVRSEGRLRVESVELKLAAGRALLGPFSFGGASPEAGHPAWRWLGPARVYRYESFGLRLEGGPTAWAKADFEAPSGLALEAGEAPLSWTATALLPGRLELPEARVEAGAASGAAGPLSIVVSELPEALAASRAIGSFSLAFERLGKGRAEAGDTLRFRLTISGRGNFPSLLFPEVEASLPAAGSVPAILPKAALRRARSDSFKADALGYSGSSSLELSLEAPRPGRLRLSVEPFPVLEPSGGLSLLRLAPLELDILPASSPLPPASSPFAGVGPAEGRLSAAAKLWAGGEEGPALAELYRLSREEPYDARLSAIAAACEKAAGAGPRLRDSLPPPALCLAAALPFALLSGLLFFGFARSRRRPKPLFILAGASLAALLCLLLLGLSWASTAERGRRYAVAWAAEALVVPSGLAEGRLPLQRGATALVIGQAPGYVGLRFADGSSGWVGAENVQFY